MKTPIVLIFVVLISINYLVAQDELIPYRIGDKWGYADANRNIIIAPQFDEVHWFWKDRARIVLDNKTGFIRKDGTFIIEPKYHLLHIAFLDVNDQPIYALSDSVNWALVDVNGDFLTGFEFQSVNGFRELDILSIRNLENESYFIDRNLKRVIPKDADYELVISSFEIKNNTPRLKDDFSKLVDNRRLVRSKTNLLYGFINEKHELVVPPISEEKRHFSDGCLHIKKEGKYGFIDKNGKVIVDFIYEKANKFSNGLAPVRKDGLWGYIDKKGKVILPFKYKYASYFVDGLAVISLDYEKYACINTKGEIVIPFYDDISEYDLDEELVLIMSDDKCGYCNKSGEVIVPTIYKDCAIINTKPEKVIRASLHSGETSQRLSGYGLIDFSGNILTDFKYSLIGLDHKYEGFVKVAGEKGEGLVNLEGKEFIAPEYGTLSFYIYNNEPVIRVSGGGSTGIVDKYTGDVLIDFNQFDVIYTFEQDITVACNGDKCYFINVMGEIQREIPYTSIRNVSLRKKGSIILYRENDVQISVSPNDSKVANLNFLTVTNKCYENVCYFWVKTESGEIGLINSDGLPFFE